MFHTDRSQVAVPRSLGVRFIGAGEVELQIVVFAADGQTSYTFHLG